MQKHVNLVDLVKSFPTNTFLQNLASIHKRTSPIKFAHLAEKSEKGSTSNLSTKVETAHSSPWMSRRLPRTWAFFVWLLDTDGDGDISMLDVADLICKVIVSLCLICFVYYFSFLHKKPTALDIKQRRLFGIALLWLFSGVYFFVFVNGIKFVSALYHIVQVVTTVGYGNSNILTDTGKIFMSFYVLIGIGVIAQLITFIGDAADAAVQKSSAAQIEAAAKQIQDTGLEKASENVTRPLVSKELNCLFKSLVPVTIALLAGTLFFRFYESCACRFGKSAIKGCEEERCGETGGDIKTLVDAFYMSCITLTTVGYGDFVTGTPLGYIFSIFWMLYGVLSVGKATAGLSDYMDHVEDQKKKMTLEDWQAADTDGNGTLSKEEFVKFILVQEGFISLDTYGTIENQFDTIAKQTQGKSNEVGLSDAMKFYDLMKSTNI